VTHPAVRELLESLARHSAFQEVVRRLGREETQQLSLSGLTTTAKALYVVLLWQAIERPVLLVVDGNKQADTMLELAAAFFDLIVGSRDVQRPQIIPALDVIPSQNLSPHSEIAEQRAI
jgi:transcription-repair coupling factor (superfamily II helicase)